MLTITDLRVVYSNGNEALKSIDFSAGKGEIIAIIGRSGAGKSTLLRCINGLQRATSGKVVLDGEDITAMNDAQLRVARRKIGFIWQEYNLVDRLPVMTNVLTGRLGYKTGIGSFFGYFGIEDRQVALKSLERVNMLHRAQFRADRLSGGKNSVSPLRGRLRKTPKFYWQMNLSPASTPNFRYRLWKIWRG